MSKNNTSMNREVNYDAVGGNLHVNLVAGLMRLEERIEHFKKRKAAILARTLEQAGANEALTKKLRELGLPKQIFVGPLVNSVIVAQFSCFAPVCCHHLLDGHVIMFSWADEYNLPTEAPTLFPGHTKLNVDAVGI